MEGLFRRGQCPHSTLFRLYGVCLFAPVAAVVTVGRAETGKSAARGRRRLRRFRGSARFDLSILRRGNHRGGNWAALALSGRPALGVAASTFPSTQGRANSRSRGPVAFYRAPFVTPRSEERWPH